MPSRLVRCSKCDGDRLDERGHPCVECGGAGVFRWGNELSGPELASELAAVERILATDRAELAEAERAYAAAEGPVRAGRHGQVVHLGESVAYWVARRDFLVAELAAAEAGVGGPRNPV